MKTPVLKKQVIKIFQKFGLSKDHAFDMASKIKEICIELEINFIYKST